MSITIENDEQKTSLSIDGELTIYTAQEYTQSIIDELDTASAANKNLELDLSKVEEVDISGLQILAAMAKELVHNCHEMQIIAASEVAKEALETSQLLTNLTCEKQESVQQETAQ